MEPLVASSCDAREKMFNVCVCVHLLTMEMELNPFVCVSMWLNKRVDSSCVLGLAQRLREYPGSMWPTSGKELLSTLPPCLFSVSFKLCQFVRLRRKHT